MKYNCEKTNQTGLYVVALKLGYHVLCCVNVMEIVETMALRHNLFSPRCYF